MNKSSIFLHTCLIIAAMIWACSPALSDILVAWDIDANTYKSKSSIPPWAKVKIVVKYLSENGSRQEFTVNGHPFIANQEGEVIYAQADGAGKLVIFSRNNPPDAVMVGTNVMTFGKYQSTDGHNFARWRLGIVVTAENTPGQPPSNGGTSQLPPFGSNPAKGGRSIPASKPGNYTVPNPNIPAPAKPASKPSPRKSFFFNYLGKASERHDVVQTLLGDWIELMPDKTTHLFQNVGRDIVEGNSGTVIKDIKSDYYLFIPDQNAAGAFNTLLRQKQGSNGAWGAFQYIVASDAGTPLQLYFNYLDKPTERHDLVKTMNNDWIEVYPDTSTNLFHTDARTTLDGNIGTVIKNNKGDFYLFIPDRNATGNQNTFIRQRSGTNGTWGWFQRMLFK